MIQCTEVPGEDCLEGDGETGGSEASGGETGEAEGPRALNPGECRHNELGHDPVTGYVYQCEGELYTHLSFTANDKDCVDILGQSWCVQHHPFTNSLQPYAAAEVIACCGEYDPDHSDTFDQACIHDTYQQLCVTVAERLEASVNAGEFGIYTNTAAELQTWIAEHYTDCFNALKDNNTAPFPDMVSSWTIGDFGPLEDIVVHIDAPSTVFGVNIPNDESEWIECTSADANNDRVFEDQSGGGVIPTLSLATPIDAALTGPPSYATKVSATTRFETTCSPRGCPAAALSIDQDTLTLTELELFEDDPVEISAGDFSLLVDRVSISLWTRAEGHAVVDPDTGEAQGFAIPAGAAQFMVAGLAQDHGANRLMAQNTGAIELIPSDTGWTLGPLELAFIDGSGAAWTVKLDGSEWRE